jgi:hypothetical protein
MDFPLCPYEFLEGLVFFRPAYCDQQLASMLEAVFPDVHRSSFSEQSGCLWLGWW